MPSPTLTSSSAPSRYNNYRVTSRTTLNDVVWNASIGDLALRMAAVEEKATGYDNLVKAGIGIALDRINEALLPGVTQVSALIVQTQGYLDQLQGSTIGAVLIVTDPQRRFVTDAQITEIAAVPNTIERLTVLEASLARFSSRAFYLSTM